MNIDKIPILKSLVDYHNEGAIPFHMPGHKKGSIYSRLGFNYFDTSFLNLDVTEVSGIDNLHCPESAIMEAQQLAASTFGAEHTFFLVNGTTGGIYSMILASTFPGDKIIIPRNAHRAVTGAVILGRLNPVYIYPEIDDQLKTAMGVTPKAVEEMLVKYPDAKAVVITSPTFYGVCSDIKAISEVVHRHNKTLIVDEAHGAHFRFNNKLPISAIEAGADIVAQSTHKTLPAMTQSSMLHVKADRVDLDRLRFFLQLTQTTSPSHILMVSLDIARYIMQEKGNELLDRIINNSSRARIEINHIDGFYCLGKDKIGSCGVHDIDETRLAINVEGFGISGCEVDKILRQNFKIQLEMSDLYNIVAIATVGDEDCWYKKLVKSLYIIASENLSARLLEDDNIIKINMKNISAKQAILPWEAVNREKECVDIKAALGRVSAEMVIPYPPGIPVIMPGEVVTKEAIEYVLKCMEKGIKINGPADISLKKLSVIK